MKKYTKWVSRSILISIFSIAVVLIFTLDTTTTEVVREIRPGYILAALVIHLFSFVIWGLRIKSMTSALGYKVGLFRSFEIVVSGTFVAAMTPSSIGGEPLRIHLLRQDQIPIGKATAVILGERILDAILMLLAAPFSIYLFHGILSDPRINVVVILGGLLSVISLIIMFYALLRPRYVKLAINSLVAWMIKRFSGKKIGEKLYRFSESIDTEIDEFHESMYIFCTEGRVGLFYGIVFTIIYWIVDFSSLPVILLGLNQPPSVLNLYCSAGTAPYYYSCTFDSGFKWSSGICRNFYIFSFYASKYSRNCSGSMESFYFLYKHFSRRIREL